ncbi:PIN domain-containing protein [Ideonella azotifigens]|uniref:PIN domain-containing protein n=1 Tax=Ideonella azotifigens TaxID=513160 RepID=A0ABN1K6D7_9BURK|nr:PIN domain-containing protein [Ideonella azotifigens]MCD2342559.1 PIN domain-containing protein [Ideonella azotifigens]
MVIAPTRLAPVILDACVMYPIVISDALLTLATAGLLVPKWTAQIDAEWTRNLARDNGKPAGFYDRRRDAARRAVPDWEVPAAQWTPHLDGLRLPDPGDRHVLAAAIAAAASCIVTANLKDFPQQLLNVHGIRAVHPDDFLVQLLATHAAQALAAFKIQRTRLANPPLTPEEFATAFARAGLGKTAERLRESAALI